MPNCTSPNGEAPGRDPRSFIEFFDGRSNRWMRYVYPNSGEWYSGWILFKNPGDGQWVTLRKPTRDDTYAIDKAVAEAHHVAD